ncbi:hypothetical protein [Mycolicibacterium phlei]|uniref:hypothetical protein n=1 Tax=Mycolicibacterium phlei TaxID=1771 RepID=UPI00031C9EB5|nr:hypothetical protein [Mycolicibacterium phlei]MBF4194646.1 hypothetical protein [Mycolicibacterium phlei]
MSLYDTAAETLRHVAALRSLSAMHPDYEREVTELADCAEELAEHIGGELPLTERLADMLRDRDPNGLRPTRESLDVLALVIDAIDAADELGDCTVDGYVRHITTGLKAAARARAQRETSEEP